MPLTHQKIDLEEIQSADIAEVARHKIDQAYAVAGVPVIIDDFGFCIDALNGLPGPFTKFFVQPADGLEKLCRITDSLDSRAAKVMCAIAYKDAHETKIFVKSLAGAIATHPRGTRGIATDMIFEPEDYGGKTRAELDEAEYDNVYLGVRPLEELKAFLASRR